MNEVHTLSGAYALDALTDDERTLFEQHLAECAECRREVDSFRETAAQLAALSDEPPPDRLRDDILSSIRTVRQLPPLVTEPDAGAPETVVAMPRRQPDRGGLRRGRLLLAAAAAVVVVAGGVGLAVDRPWESHTTQVSATEKVLSASDAKSVTVDLARGGKVTVVRSVSQGNRAVLVTKGMSEAPHGHTYVVWLQNSKGAMVNAGYLGSGRDQAVMLRGDVATAQGAGITVETNPDATVPTTKPVALLHF